MKRITVLSSVFLLLILSGMASSCKDDIPDDIPTCIADRIRKIKSEPVWNPPATIWQYHYNGQTVYYIPARCCDISDALIDDNCNLVCDMGGGVTGRDPDSVCADFIEKQTDEKLIWADKRTYP